MSCAGWLLVFLGIPLLIGFVIGGKKNLMWRNLGILLLGVGVLGMVVGAAVGF